MVAGAVLVNTVTAAHMTMNDVAAAVRRDVDGVKYSSNTQMLSAMLTIGSTITRNGCETLRGPTWRVTWLRIAALAPAMASA